MVETAVHSKPTTDIGVKKSKRRLFQFDGLFVAEIFSGSTIGAGIGALLGGWEGAFIGAMIGGFAGPVIGEALAQLWIDSL